MRSRRDGVGPRGYARAVDETQLHDLIERAIRAGATPGRPASPAAIDDAQDLLGVRFDEAYRSFLLRCNGIERLGEADLYPVDELGVSARWLDWDRFLRLEYFSDLPGAFEMRGDEQVPPVFHPAPPGQRHVLIGHVNGSLCASLVANFAVAAGPAVTGEVAQCRYEPWLLGPFDNALPTLVDDAQRWISDGIGHPYSEAWDQLGSVDAALASGTLATIRHCVSARWRAEIDAVAPDEALAALRARLWGSDTRPTTFTVDFPAWENGVFQVLVGDADDGLATVRPPVVLEDHVWRLDGWPAPGANR